MLRAADDGWTDIKAFLEQSLAASESSLRAPSAPLHPPNPQSAVALLLLLFRLHPDNKEKDVFSRQVFAGLFPLSTGAEK